MITYRPGSQQGRSDALLRRSYLVSKEREAPYDQQYFDFLRPDRLLLRTLYSITLVDPTFLKDISIILLLDPLALEFKQLYADFRSQNGQIKVADFQTPDLEILDPESSDFLNSSSRSIDHMKAKALR
jgi:hypothetical protein